MWGEGSGRGRHARRGAGSLPKHIFNQSSKREAKIPQRQGEIDGGLHVALCRLRGKPLHAQDSSSASSTVPEPPCTLPRSHCPLVPDSQGSIFENAVSRVPTHSAFASYAQHGTSARQCCFASKAFDIYLHLHLDLHAERSTIPHLSSWGTH